jgi:hypothetical protein
LTSLILPEHTVPEQIAKYFQQSCRCLAMFGNVWHRWTYNQSCHLLCVTEVQAMANAKKTRKIERIVESKTKQIRVYEDTCKMIQAILKYYPFEDGLARTSAAYLEEIIAPTVRADYRKIQAMDELVNGLKPKRA